MGVSINTTICITEECKYQFQFQYEGQWKQPFHIKRMHWVNQTIRISWNKRGTFFRGKIRLQGHGTVVVCAAAALHPKKDGLSGSKEEERRGGRRPSHRHRQNRPQSATRPESRGARATRRGELGSDIFRVWAPQPSPPLIFPPQWLYQNRNHQEP